MNQTEKKFYINDFLSYGTEGIFSNKKRKLCPFIKDDRSLFCLTKNNRFRSFLKRVVEHKIFDTTIMLVIFVNCITLAMNKVYSKNDSTPIEDILDTADYYFLAIFFTECVLKIIAYGFILHPKSYLRNFWNVLDFTIVTLGIVSLLLNYLIKNKFDVKALRAFRVLRPLRLVTQVQSLQIVVNSILIALIPLANVGLIIICLLIIYAILGMSIFIGRFHSTCYNNVTLLIMSNPVPCNSLHTNIGFNCSIIGPLAAGQGWECFDKDKRADLVQYAGPNYGINNFDNIGLALITVFQIITRQGWTDVMYSASNIFGNSWTWIYFVSLVILGSYFLLNLVVVVLCGEFIKEKTKVERRSKYFAERQNIKEMEDYLNYKEWIEYGEKIDKLCEDDNVIKTPIDIRPDDESSEEEEHEHRFENFMRSLADFKKKCFPYKAKSQQYLLGIIKSRIYFIVILSLVFINCAIMASEFYDQPHWLTAFQDYSNVVFVLMFTIEMIVKLYTLGIKNYFSKIFNVYDFVVISISLIETALTLANIMNQVGFSILRSLRLLRIFKLTRYWDYMRTLANNMLKSIKSILSLILLLVLFICIFSLLGMQIFGGKYNFNENRIIRSNFNDLFQAMISVFQLITAERWNEEMYNGVQALQSSSGLGSFAVVYFVSVVIIGNYILLNVFFAIVLEILASSENEDKKKENKKGNDVESESSDLDPDEKELDVPVIDRLVMVNGCALMPPNVPSDIISLDMVKTKCRKYADSEKRVRMVIKIPEEEQPKFTCAQSKVKYEELYGEDEEDAIKVGVDPAINLLLNRIRVIQPKKKLEKIPTGASFYIFSSNNKFRRICYRIISHTLTRNIVFVVIICSSLQLAFTDPINTNTPKSIVLQNFDYGFTGIFTLELLLNLIAYGVILHKGAYLRSMFNWIDFIVVAIGIVDMFSPFTQIKISAVKTVRIIRIVKLLREIKQAKELKHIINSLAMALSNMWKIVLVTVLLQFTFAVIGVILFKGSFYKCTDLSRNTKETCMGQFMSYSTDGFYTGTVQDRSWYNNPLNFDNVFQAMLTLFVVSTYQGYPYLLYVSIDATTSGAGPYFNTNRAVFIYYLIYFIVIKFFLLNIFIGFVVISYQKARELQFKSDEMNKNQKQCIAFVLKARPIMKFIPTIRYQYFVWQVVISRKFDYAIFAVVILNTISMCAAYDGSPPHFRTIQIVFSYLFVGLFTLEAILKMIAFNVRNYFDDGMNIFDLIVLLGTYVDLVFRYLQLKPIVDISIFRLFRALRLVKLLMKIVAIRKMIWTFIQAFKTLPWVILLVFLIFFTYSIVGMQFFGPIGFNNPGSAITNNNNFQTLLDSFLLLFRCVTGENWQDIMISCSDPIKSQCENSVGNCGSILSYFYFSSFVLICTYMVMNLFLAVLIYNFDYLTMDFSILSPHHLQDFIEKWSEFDIAARGRIKPLDLICLLTKISPPLGFGKLCSHDRCMRRLMHMNIPLENDGTILFHSVLFSLTRISLKIKVPLGVKDLKSLDEYNDELRATIKKLWPNTSTSLLDQIIPTNMKETVTVGKYYAIFVIQNMFRKWKLRKQEKEEEKAMEFLDSHERDVNKITAVVLHQDESLPNLEPEEPSPLVIMQERYNRFTDLLWNNLSSIFTLPEDNEETE